MDPPHSRQTATAMRPEQMGGEGSPWCECRERRCWPSRAWGSHRGLLCLLEMSGSRITAELTWLFSLRLPPLPSSPLWLEPERPSAFPQCLSLQKPGQERQGARELQEGALMATSGLELGWEWHRTTTGGDRQHLVGP